MGAKFAEKLQIVPLYAPVVCTATSGVESASVALKNVQWLTFMVYWGAMTSESSDTMTIGVETSTAAGSTTNATAITFTYRLSAGVGDDNWGDATTCAATGVSITAAQDNMTLLIDVDPAGIPAEDSDALFANVFITPVSLVTNYAIGVHALIEPRYPKVENLSTTA
jgi:hypothetical protein